MLAVCWRRYLRAIRLTRRIQINKSMIDSYESAIAIIDRPCFRAILFLETTVAIGAAMSVRSSFVSLTSSRSLLVRSDSSMSRNRTSHRYPSVMSRRTVSPRNSCHSIAVGIPVLGSLASRLGFSCLAFGAGLAGTPVAESGTPPVRSRIGIS